MHLEKFEEKEKTRIQKLAKVKSFEKGIAKAAFEKFQERESFITAAGIINMAKSSAGFQK